MDVPSVLRIATLVAALSLLVSGCGGSSAAGNHSGASNHRIQSASMMLDWYPNSDHGGIFTAVQKGFFRRHGIALTAHVPSDTSAQIKLVAAGKADFGITYEADVLAARARHIPVQSVMCIVQHPLNTVMTLAGSGIKRPRDLVGHKVGMAGDPSDIPIVSAMVSHDGASINQVQMINVGYQLLPALLSRRVDAVIGVYWTWEAIQARAKGYPVNVMRVERWGVPNHCELVLVAADKTIRTRPVFVRDTVQAMQQGYAYAEAHPAEAWQALHTQDKTLNQSLVLQSLRLLKPVITDTRTIGYQNAGQWTRYASWLATNHLISGSVDASHAFTNQFLSPAIR